MTPAPLWFSLLVVLPWGIGMFVILILVTSLLGWALDWAESRRDGRRERKP